MVGAAESGGKYNQCLVISSIAVKKQNKSRLLSSFLMFTTAFCLKDKKAAFYLKNKKALLKELRIISRISGMERYS